VQPRNTDSTNLSNPAYRTYASLSFQVPGKFGHSLAADRKRNAKTKIKKGHADRDAVAKEEKSQRIRDAQEAIVQEDKIYRHWSLPGCLLLFPEGHADSGIMNGGFPAVRLGESLDEFLAALAPIFTVPNGLELLLKRHTEFPRLESIPNVIGEGVQNTLSSILQQTQHDISETSAVGFSREDTLAAVSRLRVGF
jgi:hypothetical protein